MNLIIFVAVLTLPVLGLIRFDQWRIDRWARRVEGPNYETTNQAISLTGGSATAVRVK